MAIIPREIQEEIEKKEEQLKLLNVKLKSCLRDKEIFKKKLGVSNVWKLVFIILFLIVTGAISYSVIFKKKLPLLPSGEDDKLKQQNEYLMVENSTLKNRLDSLSSHSTDEQHSKGSALHNYDGVLYRVQLGAFKKFRVKPFSDNISSLFDEYSIDLYKKYSIGVFSNVNDAKKLRKDLIRLGFRDCFIVFEYKGNRISYKEAKKIERSRK